MKRGLHLVGRKSATPEPAESSPEGRERSVKDGSAWTQADLRAWRKDLGWTQARAAEALGYHVQAYKKLEGGTRSIMPQLRKLCILTRKEYRRALVSSSGYGASRQA